MHPNPSIVVFCFAACILTGSFAIASNNGPTISTAQTLTAANWLVAAPLLLILIVAFGIHFRRQNRMRLYRETIKNPGRYHSQRQYHTDMVASLSAILPSSTFVHGANLNLTAADNISPSRLKYRQALNWTTNIFGSLRVFTYVPTIMTLWASSDSNQYSILTWTAWVIANASLTASLYENNGRKIDNLVLVNFCNALMCLVTVIVILYLRYT